MPEIEYDNELVEHQNCDSESDRASSMSDQGEPKDSHYLPINEQSKLRSDIDFQQFLDESEKYEGFKADRSQLYLDQNDDAGGMNEYQTPDEFSQGSSSSGHFDHDDKDDQIEQGNIEESNIQDDIQKLAVEQQRFVHHLKQSQTEVAVRGRQVKNQLKIGDSLMDLRIRTQRLLNMVDVIVPLHAGNQSDSARSFAKQSVQSLATSLVEVTQLMVEHNSQLFLNANLVDINALKRKHDNRDDYMQSLYVQVKIQERQCLTPSFQQTLDKWHQRLSVTARKNFKALDQPLSIQIKNVLQNDCGRLYKRTRLNRQIGLVSNDDAIFDDGDFYQMQLKDLISQKSASEEAALGGLQPLSMHQQPNKLRQLDRKFNKDRTVKFTAMDKLVNFMTCRPDPSIPSALQWHQEMITAIQSSMK